MASETFRYATLVLSREISIPVFDRFDRSSAISIDSMRYMSPVADGEYFGLTDISGDLSVAEELLESSDEVLQYDIAGTDERGVIYAHYRSDGPIDDLLSILYRNKIVLDWPVEHRLTDRGPELRFTVIGTNGNLQRAIDDVPDLVDASVTRIGHLESKSESTAVLTDTQADLLDLAIREGYYEVPKETTQRALADRLGVTPGTIGDRLQRIERRVMTEYELNTNT
ncbi:DNA-binding protein [Haladaptatus sp. R4]|uniref:helix-turn-helix domain-containing protein n=1 Tax=Haladaptatus sp. R4 TaxID=1679489 RepID=UPI0007B49762|nr:helix-turn-helix domain-containing protein [Haladaptatus sp. R4]KZN25772.1 DNA-binding protein [Haladaptatus sp. R4]